MYKKNNSGIELFLQQLKEHETNLQNIMQEPINHLLITMLLLLYLIPLIESMHILPGIGQWKNDKSMLI
ncbi:hypothetical protein I7I48_03140 [Histoplasma ohiense]|nr:hypothetical protein I7I48_03140 [Histoplasma ohiense (nom. inval.)]